MAANKKKPPQNRKYYISISYKPYEYTLDQWRRRCYRRAVWPILFDSYDAAWEYGQLNKVFRPAQNKYRKGIYTEDTGFWAGKHIVSWSVQMVVIK